MTLIVDNRPTGPALHAFVIGVGYYRHLPGGSGPVLDNTLDLEQVRTPPLSAQAVLHWLTTDYANTAAPLGTVELLMSTEDDFRHGTTPVDRATLANTQQAVDAWFDRCTRSPGNLAFFYFCGHGLERDKQYLLLEDFGQAPRDPLAASIDLDRFHDGMAACAADTQVFIADACRQVPWDLIRTYGDMGNPLIPPALGGNTDRNAPILRAAAQGRPAFGAPGEVTNFTSALLLALRGAGATEELDGTDRWVVRYLALASAVQTLLAETATEGARQECRTGGEAADLLLAELRTPPEVTVQIDCHPPDSAPFAALTLTSELRGASYDRQPGAGSWRLSVPADYAYRLAATYLDGRYPAWARNVPVLPPLRRISAQVTR
jgi:Caspase domain